MDSRHAPGGFAEVDAGRGGMRPLRYRVVDADPTTVDLHPGRPLLALRRSSTYGSKQGGPTRQLLRLGRFPPKDSRRLPKPTIYRNFFYSHLKIILIKKYFFWGGFKFAIAAKHGKHKKIILINFLLVVLSWLSRRNINTVL